MSAVKLIAHTPDPEKIVAVAARLCYSRFSFDRIWRMMDDSEVRKGIATLNEMKHESPIEHAVFTFSVSGISRACMAQFTRHRIASFSVKSQRYVDEKNFKFLTPPSLRNDPEFAATMAKLHDIYLDLKKKGHPNEDARFVLPNSCNTQLITTMNARSLRNFFTLRCCHRAQWEIRDVANKMLRECKKVAPLLFANQGPACLRGPCPEGRMGDNCPMRK
jgi:thymidylate synthase (FAD)